MSKCRFIPRVRFRLMISDFYCCPQHAHTAEYRRLKLGGRMNYKRILKTGLLAVAATIAFAIFAYRAAEWSKGLNSEMIVLGQNTGGPGGGGTGGSGGCTTGASGTSSAQITKVIPQM